MECINRIVIRLKIIGIDDGIATHHSIIIKSEINGLELLVGECAILHQHARVELRHIQPLQIEGNAAVYKLAVHKLIPVAESSGGTVHVNQILVVIRRRQCHLDSDKSHIFKTIAIHIAVKAKQNRIIGGGCGDCHILESHKVGPIELQCAVIGITGVAGHHYLLVIGSHASENHSVAQASARNMGNRDILFVSARSHFKNHRAGHTGGEGGYRRGKGCIIGIRRCVAINGVNT